MSSRLRERIVLITAAFGFVIGSAFLIELLLSLRIGEAFGHTQRGHVAGWLGLAITLLVLVYPIKKRTGPKPGWPKGWFRVHMVAGIFGPIVILVHSGAHFHALVPVLALAAMGLVVISGIVGQGIHYLVLRGLNAQKRELVAQGLSSEEIDTRLHRLAAQEEAFRVWQCLHAPLTITFVALTLLHVGGALFFGGW